MYINFKIDTFMIFVHKNLTFRLITYFINLLQNFLIHDNIGLI